MVVLESCPKHNMVAYLEKTDGNVEFHEIIDFLARSSIHNALTVSPVFSTTFVEQFWMSAKSKIINNVRYITTKVAGKSMSISEASIRSDLLFNDADRIDSLPYQAIFDAIQLMGYEGDLTGKHFSGKVTPLFSNMLVQPTEDEGKQSERPSELQLTPSPPHPSEVHVEPQFDPSPRPSPTTHIPNSILESSGGNHGVTDQAKEIQHLKAQIKKLKKKAKPVISHHRAWMKSVSLKQRLAGKKSLKKQWMQKESLDDVIDNIETVDAQDKGRTRYVVHEEKERGKNGVSTEDALGTDKDKDSTDRPDEGTDKQKVSTDKEEVSTDRPDEGTVDQTEGRSATPTTPTPTPTTFGDDETIAQVLLNMSQAKAVSREKEKGVELKDVENIERPRPTSTRSLLTLKPLPKIDPKDKGKKKIKEDESDTESEDINETEKKFKMLAHDEEIARKMQEDWEAEAERKRLAEEEATNAALIQDFDDIKARIEADRLLALRLQEEERESKQRAAAIRNRPPTRTQLRSQMMTYLKHVGNKKHSDLKNKTFEEIQALYEKVKRFDESFTVVGSNEDERKIKEMNEKAKDIGQMKLKKRVAKETAKKEDTTKVPAKVDVTEQSTKKRKGGHMKMIARKRKRPQPDVDSDDEHRKCLKIVTFEANGNFRAFNYLLEVLHIFDRQDLFHLYDLVMKQYSKVTLEGFELILWGDLKIMMESSTEENNQSDFWNNQQN
ncbi:hypothetical protein Tco_0541248 [Tanacetum coccineum]